MNKYEQLIEHIINDNEQAAKELFHQIVVEKSRDIYESLMDEEQMEENFGGNPSEQFVNNVASEVQGDEQGIGEDDEEGAELELGGDDDGEETFGDEPGEEHEEHSDIETKIDDLSAQLEELKAMLAGEEHGEESGEEMPGEEHSDFDSEEGFGAPHEEEHGMMEGENPFAKKSGSGMSGSGKSGSGMSGSGKSGSGKSGSGVKESRKLSDVEIMKEYVDKIGEIYKQEPATGEGKTVGTGGDAPTVNTTGVVRKQEAKFDGETAANIATGGAEQNPDGKQYSKPKNVYSKGETTVPGAGKFQNVPGAKAKQEKTGKEYSKDHGAEGQTTDGKVAVTSKSVVGGKVR